VHVHVIAAAPDRVHHRCMARILDIAIVAVGLIGTTLLGASAAGAADTCTCRAPGGLRVELGGTTCLSTPTGPRLARCVMDVNILSWQFLEAPCVVSWSPVPQDRLRFAVVAAEPGPTTAP
jgi:hypothetical protein